MMFTPTTPYVHKFRTEMCKNFETYGRCKYGDEVSTDLICSIRLICQHENKIWIKFWYPIFKFESHIE
jgi:hypothetical protein